MGYQEELVQVRGFLFQAEFLDHVDQQALLGSVDFHQVVFVGVEARFFDVVFAESFEVEQQVGPGEMSLIQGLEHLHLQYCLLGERVDQFLVGVVSQMGG